jgi:hypothetical protein
MKTITIILPQSKEYLRSVILLEMAKSHVDWQITFEPCHSKSLTISVSIPPENEIGDGAIAKSTLIEVQKILLNFGITF